MNLKAGDIITYRNLKTHYVNQNKINNYKLYYKKNKHNNNTDYDIVKIQRYKKFLGIYILKTIWREYDN